MTGMAEGGQPEMCRVAKLKFQIENLCRRNDNAAVPIEMDLETWE